MNNPNERLKYHVTGAIERGEKQAIECIPVKDAHKTKMNFRKWPDGTIDALMPEEEHGCASYTHIGQHGQADYFHCIASTSPARPEEYAPLLNELTSIGYNVQVIKKWMRK